MSYKSVRHNPVVYSMIAVVSFYGVVLSYFVWHADLAPGTWADDIFRLGAFNIAGWLMVFARARRLISPHQRARLIILVALVAALAVLCVNPCGVGGPFAIALLGAGILLQPAIPRSSQQAGWLLLALALSHGLMFLNPFSLPFAPLDAQVVAALLRLAGLTASATGPVVGDGRFSIMILSGCSSVAPLGGVLLAYLVIRLHLNGDVRRSDLPWLLASLLTSILLTELRLCLMVPSFDAWDWWHNGPGVTVYELAALAAAALFPLLASRPARA